MNFVDRKFKMLIRMYEGPHLQEAIKGDRPVPFRVAAKRITHTDITGWGEMRFREEVEVEEQRGEFPCTIINFLDGDDIICAWPMKKFEEELRKFSEKYEEWQDQEILKNMKEEAAIFNKGEDLSL